ncbi:hypothetical protein O3P69_004741 [Scylla paramamosain]|uniref:SCP domain-containing protein n=1 Tax=Scylla paramamosain TaxID=85552 RepID=A0AAW0UEE7_SCYPA
MPSSTPPPRPPPPPPIVTRPAADRTQMISLLTKVWSGRGASVQERGTGEVEWAHSQFVLECVSEHNRFRALHDAPPLVLSEQLCLDAQSWANRLAHFGLLEYSTEHGRGENILTSTTKDILSGTAVVGAWYETGRNFKYNVPGPADLAQAGPFSQVVWQSTRSVGVGVARSSDGRTVVVARYWPPGNLGGAFGSNVKPPKGEVRARTPQGTPIVSRTRQEAKLYVKTALEPPGKAKRTDRDWLAGALRLPSVRKASAGGGSGGGGGRGGSGGEAGHTILGVGAGPGLAATLASCRNGAARTCRLVPVCCVPPPRRGEERWARPSTRPPSRLTRQPVSVMEASPAAHPEMLPLKLTPETPRRPLLRAAPLAFAQDGRAGQAGGGRLPQGDGHLTVRWMRLPSLRLPAPLLPAAARRVLAPQRALAPAGGGGRGRGYTLVLKDPLRCGAWWWWWWCSTGPVQASCGGGGGGGAGAPRCQGRLVDASRAAPRRRPRLPPPPPLSLSDSRNSTLAARRRQRRGGAPRRPFPFPLLHCFLAPRTAPPGARTPSNTAC